METGAVATKSKGKEDLAQLLQVLDEKSRAILWYLWWYRHAEISQLRELIDASTDFEVLFRLRDVINRKAQKLWGKSIVGFEQGKVDPLIGEKVLFSWWFLDQENELLANNSKPLVDVFEEKDSVVIIAQLPGLAELSHPEAEFRNGLVKVRLKREKRC
jgi:hypothetical protein